MRAGRREEHGSSASFLLIMKYIYIWSHVQLMRTRSHVIRFLPQVAVYSRNIYIFGRMYSPHSHVIRFMPQAAVYSRSKQEAGDGILTI